MVGIRTLSSKYQVSVSLIAASDDRGADTEEGRHFVDAPSIWQVLPH